MEATKNWVRNYNLVLAIFMAFLMLIAASVDLTSDAASAECQPGQKAYDDGYHFGYEHGLKDGYKHHYEKAFIEELGSGRGWGGGWGGDWYRYCFVQGANVGYDEGQRFGASKGRAAGKSEADDWREDLLNQMRERCQNGRCD